MKNDGVLPLKTRGIKIAVVGPLADQTKVLLGNYNGTPTHTVSILEGHARRSSPARPSTMFPARSSSATMRRPFLPPLLTTDGKPGVKVTYCQAAT